MGLKITCPNASLRNYNLISQYSTQSFKKHWSSFAFFPGWRKALRDNKSFIIPVETAYNAAFAMQNVNHEASPSPLLMQRCWTASLQLTHFLIQQVSDRDSHPLLHHQAVRKASWCSLSYVRNELICKAATQELQVLWKLQTTLFGEVNLVKMLWTHSHSPSRALRQDWRQCVINSSLIIPTNIHF